MAVDDPHEDGTVASTPTRYLALILAIAAFVLLVSPPYSLKPMLTSIAAVVGLWCIYREYKFPNIWLCWMLYVIAFVQLSELEMPVAAHGFPVEFWGRFSFLVAIPCALVSFAIFMTKFVLRCIRDIRDRRPVSFDD